MQEVQKVKMIHILKISQRPIFVWQIIFSSVLFLNSDYQRGTQEDGILNIEKNKNKRKNQGLLIA